MPETPKARFSPAEAFERYETIRNRLPVPVRQGTARDAASLASLMPHYDVFVLDSFGVLNVGTHPTPGAAMRVASLEAGGKQVTVLTNAAAQPQRALLQKYRQLGFSFQDHAVISSRHLALTQLARAVPNGPIAVVGEAAAIENAQLRQRAGPPGGFASAILLLDAAGWGPETQDLLARQLADQPCPVFVANPDLVAPRETGLSLEPGYFAHDLIDRGATDVRFFGKPFGNAFAAVEAQFPQVPPHRIVMVGDTLHTDILGGLAKGWGTALVTGYGALKGLDIAKAIDRSGLHPDWVLPAI